MPFDSRDDQLKEPNRFSFWRPEGDWDARHPGQPAAALALWGSVCTSVLDFTLPGFQVRCLWVKIWNQMDKVCWQRNGAFIGFLHDAGPQSTWVAAEASTLHPHPPTPMHTQWGTASQALGDADPMRRGVLGGRPGPQVPWVGLTLDQLHL